VLSKFITSLLAGKPPTIFGDGEQSRDFTFVDNVVEANLLACTAPSTAGGMFNIATGERQTLNQTFELLCRIISKQDASALPTSIRPIYAPPRAGDIVHSQADIGAARERLGYNPKILFEEGLERTVDWYRTAE
jgi:nucleoside-diphosphate-sugar epimerase